MGKLLNVLGISEELQSRIPKSYLMRETFLEGLQKVYANASDSPRRNHLAYTISTSIRDLLADIKEFETGVPQPKPVPIPQPTPQPQQQPTPPPTPPTPRQQSTPPPTPSPAPTPTPPPTPPSRTPEEKIPLKKYKYEYYTEDEGYTDASNNWERLEDVFTKTFNVRDISSLVLKVEWQEGFIIDLYIDANDIEFLEELNAYPDLGQFLYNNWEVITDRQIQSRENYSFKDIPETQQQPTPPQPQSPKGEKKSEPIKLKSFKLVIVNKDGKFYDKEGKTWIQLSRKFIEKFDKEKFYRVYFKIVWEDNYDVIGEIYNTDKDLIEDLDNLVHFGSFVYKYWDAITDEDKRNRNDYDFTGKPASNIPSPIPSNPPKDNSNNVPSPESPKPEPSTKKKSEKIKLKLFNYLFDDGKNVETKEGKTWAELENLFKKSFNSQTIDQLMFALKWKDGYTILPKFIFKKDTELLRQLSTVDTFSDFVQNNWDLFTRNNKTNKDYYAFSDDSNDKSSKPSPESTPKKRGRPKKSETQQPEPKKKKTLDDVKTADDIAEIDINDIDI